MRVILHTDGGSRGNPGPAAAAFVLACADSRRPLREAGVHLGEATNNVAEYQGLLRGLAAAIDAGATEVAIHSDSELMVRQIRGEYKVKHPALQPLFREAMALLARLPRWTIQHVRREHNARADALVNAALDRGADVGGAGR